MMPNVRLIYVSIARSDLLFEDMKSLLKTAKILNERHEISGVLCYHQGAFLQAIEGRRSDVNQLYSNIISDPRHLRCELLQYQEIGARDFSKWSMQLIVLDGSLQRALTQRYGISNFELSQMTGSEAHILLWHLASLDRD